MWLERSHGKDEKQPSMAQRESQRLEAWPSRAGLEPASRATRFTGGGDFLSTLNLYVSVKYEKNIIISYYGKVAHGKLCNRIIKFKGQV